MILEEKRAFFDRLAKSWDSAQDLHLIRRRLKEGLEELRVGESEIVLDLGSGTGNLSECLLSRLGNEGRVLAVDISLGMHFEAAKKFKDPRLLRICGDGLFLPVKDGSLKRVICFSSWPHFSNAKGVIREINRVLAPGGFLHIWHLISRERVNLIHSQAGWPIEKDLLIPAGKLAQMLSQEGFSVLETRDEPDRYMVSGVKS